MAKAQVDLSSRGMQALLTSDAVQRAVEAEANAVAQRARSRGVTVEGEPGDVPLPVEVVDARSKSRARALVVLDHPAGEAVESQHRLLGGALG